MTIGASPRRANAERELTPEEASDAQEERRLRQTQAEQNDSAKEVWAALLLHKVAAQVVQWGSKPEPTGSEAPRGDGKLTFGAPSIDARMESSGDGDLAVVGDSDSVDQTGQIRFEMDGGRLGTVHLTVHRQGTVVSVVVGVADPLQRALVELELGSLTQALRAAGLNVGSVRVLHPDLAGTAFAQGRKGMTIQNTESASLAYRSHRNRQRADAEEGLDVVG